MAKLRDQINHFKSVMELAQDKFCSDDEDMIEKFYRSTFSIVFEDKTSNETAKIKFDMSPEVWGLFEQTIGVLYDDSTPYEDD